jgi:hypothetical protein
MIVKFAETLVCFADMQIAGIGESLPPAQL